MKQVTSPNFNDRASDISIDKIIIHYTGMKDAASALARLCDADSQVSAHYMIDEDGTIIQLVDEAKRAWHAGKSFWRGQRDINSASVGIELVNPGHEFGYRPFPSQQITALKQLMKEIVTRHSMSALLAPLAHSDIAPSRKEDPGELFPWQDLAEDGLGLWPEPASLEFAPPSEAEIRVALGTIGYDVSVLADALLAFQRRYRPQTLTGMADAETMGRLRALKRLMGV